MALSENDKKNIASWFEPRTREVEYAWLEELNKVIPMYQEMGFTRAEGALLFMVSQMLGQIGNINTILSRWDEEK